MRVPKFRAWWEKGKRMLDIAAIDFLEKEIKSHANVMYRFDEVELMQSIGIVDKNGKEIYEGDVVHAYSEGARLIGVIEYFDNAYCIKDKNGIYNSLWTNAEQYEIIGNIYENPELLEEN